MIVLEPESASPETAEVRGDGAAILLVSDSDAFMKVVTAVLQRAGFAPEGFDTISACAARRAVEPRPCALIIAGQLDVDVTPLREVEHRDGLPALPLVVLGIGWGEEEPARARAAGADVFVRRPWHPLDIIAALSIALARAN